MLASEVLRSFSEGGVLGKDKKYLIMAGARLELRHSQSLVMTPQVQQSLKILQYSTQELLNFIESEMEQNPMLVVDEQKEKPQTASENEEAVKDVVESSENSDSFSEDENVLDVNYENTWDEKENQAEQQSADNFAYESADLSASGGNAKARADFDDSATSIEQNISGNKTLREHILDQVSVEITESEEMIIASHLVDMLDESGYLTGSTEPIQEILGCEEEKINQVITKLQKLDPAGVFARNLSECLAIQLEDRHRLDPAIQALLDNLDLCADGNIKKLEKLCGVDHEDIIDMISEIKTLDPKPGANFESEITQTLIPDVYIRKNPYGSGWVIELNSDSLPKLLVNKKYYSEIKKKVSGESEKKYLSEKFGSANWLVKALNQRAETILKVVTEIVDKQADFFEKGINHLKPMTLKDIAEAIEMHESTVGRVTTNKFVVTPRGTFELKFFFSSSLGEQGAAGEELSSRTVKNRIKELTDVEDSKSILSDEKLVSLLRGEGIDVARRTVAKYREAMGIPSSSQRRKQKKLQSIT